VIAIDLSLRLADLRQQIRRLFELSAIKIRNLQSTWNPQAGTPVYTVGGRYTSRGWTEWTQGFQFGSMVLQYDATGEEEFLRMGRGATVEHMASHVSHVGVHDHGFNNISTYGNLLRLLAEGRLPASPGDPGGEWEGRFYRLALQVSGAVQAARWTELPGDLGYIYSFNGPHSLFVDTIRSLRVLAVAHQLGHVLMGEQDRRICLLERLLRHAETTARYNVYYGQGRDLYDVRGRTAHEAVFNIASGTFRNPSTQQGYSPFSTWTRGLAWALCGFTEQLEFLASLPEESFAGRKAGGLQGRAAFLERFLAAARATADFYLAHTPTDGIPYWDTGAPGLAHLGDYLGRPAEPFNDCEPVDSSAAAISAQGLLRLGRYLASAGRPEEGARYVQAGLTVARTLFAPPYLSEDEAHQGLVLHSVYHRPNGWDAVPPGRRAPAGEATMWGDYHARELALYIRRLAEGAPYLVFYLPGGLNERDV
jgi:hypothetical protein